MSRRNRRYFTVAHRAPALSRAACWLWARMAAGLRGERDQLLRRLSRALPPPDQQALAEVAADPQRWDRLCRRHRRGVPPGRRQGSRGPCGGQPTVELPGAGDHRARNPERVWDQSNSAGAVRAALDACGLRWAIPQLAEFRQQQLEGPDLSPSDFQNAVWLGAPLRIVGGVISPFRIEVARRIAAINGPFEGSAGEAPNRPAPRGAGTPSSSGPRTKRFAGAPCRSTRRQRPGTHPPGWRVRLSGRAQ